MRFNRRLGAAWCGAVVIALAGTLASATPAAEAAPSPIPRALALTTPSAKAKAKTYAAPSALKAKASAAGAGTIALTWSFRGSGLRYRVQYSTSKKMTKARTLVVPGPSAAVSGLKQRTTYYFRVRVLGVGGAAASAYSKVVSGRTATPADPGARPLQVASFNVRNATLDSGTRSWANRRTAVAGQIKAKGIDVVGLQEAEYTRISVDGTTVHQYEDLLGLLGGSYRITSGLSTAEGCGVATESDDSLCSGTTAAAPGYSAGIRIIYNSDTVTLVKRGSVRLTDDIAPRYAVWAIFTQVSTGRSFFFINAHLEDKYKDDPGLVYYALRKTQADQVLATIAANNPGLPVVLTGDMNSHKWRDPANAPYDSYRAAGLVDPLGNTYKSRTAVKPTTEVRIHTEFNSWNNFAAKPDDEGWINGINVDYIMVSRSVTTLEYETVVDIDPVTGRFVGTVPSDHNMLRASILVPRS
ncbi:MAG: endonuclease/exonuclease/phosphatase family protein [Propionibacteriaceae bacterium]|nr:endonuclease/exonuclease/phosphatase family protein [Propionibacteriaceae bacterium]